MNTAALLKSFIMLLLIGQLAAAPLAAGHERPHPAARVVQPDDNDADGVTFDNLLRASSYTCYIEARNIGALLHSTEFRETFEPISPLLQRFTSGGGTETMLVRLVTDNADRLQRSRMMVAFSPADASLPILLLGFELESEDAAEEFEATAKERFGALASLAQKAAKSTGGDATASTNSIPTVIRRAERLVVISATPFNFKDLRGANDKLMSDDMNFRAARDRFYTEPLFVYYDAALSERHRKAFEESMHKPGEPAGNTPTLVFDDTATPEVAVVQSSNTAKSSGRASDAPRRAPSQAPPPRKSGVAAPPRAAVPTLPVAETISVDPAVASPPPPPPPPARNEADPLDNLFKLMLSGEAPKPEAIAVGLGLEHDALVVRALFVSPPSTGAALVPFLSPPILGPAISSEAADYLPADTGIFVVASLDWARLYDLATRPPRTPRVMPKGPAAQAASFDTRRAAFEKASGVRIADLLVATLGNEIALSVPASYLSSTPLGRVAMNATATASTPLMLVAVRDRQALAPKLPGLLEALGVKTAAAKATAEKVGDIEITSYGNVAYAFVNNYLLMATNVARVRQALEAHTRHTTLAASTDFQSYTEWLPRANIAQLYVSAGVLKGFFRERPSMNNLMDQETKEFLARYRFDPEPITFAVSTEGVGTHYELRLPRRLLMRFFAEIAAVEVASRVPRNEMLARVFLRTIQEQEKAYKAQHGKYASLDDIVADDKTSDSSARKYNEFNTYKMMLEQNGYKLAITASDSSYEATATPNEYGKTGRLSFYTDQSGVIREGDHQGKPASSSDKPVNKNMEY